MSQDAGDETAPDGRGDAPLRTVRAHSRAGPAAGTRIGRYIVERELGAGGMGVVVAARDPELDRRIAIKLLHGPVAGTQVRLLREGQAIARLRHPNVIAVHDVGMHEGGMFIAMELVEGVTLRRWLAQPRTWREVLAVFVQVGHGLAAAHAAGLIHRDVKPENVLLDDGGRVVVTDFGLARTSDDVTSTPRDSQSVLDLDVTKTGATLGTPAYMSPEQFRHGPIDARSDQFSFCVALFEALHGARPFPSSTFDQLRDAVIAGRISAPRRKLPARVQRIIARGLAVAPAARFPTMNALVDALGAAARPRWPWLATVPALAGVMLALAMHWLGGAPADSACENEPSLLVGRWDVPARAALAARLGSGATVQERTAIAKVFAAYDGHASTITELQRKTCERRARDEIGAQEAAVIDSCLVRRAIELGVSWRGIVINRAASPVAVESDAEWTLPPESCREVDAPAMTATPTVVASLYTRALLPSHDATNKETDLQRATVLEQDCDRAGELELAAIVSFQIANMHGDDLSTAKQAFEDTYRRALAIHDGNRAVLALLGESWTMSLAGDRAGARGVVHAARDQAERSVVSGRTRARLYLMLGKSDKFAGDLAGAATALQDGLNFIARDGRDLREVEYSLRYDLIDTLAGIDGKSEAALGFARASLVQTRTLFGDHSYELAEMRDMLAVALEVNGLIAEAVVERRAALALGRETHDSDRWLVDTGIALGRDLCTLGQWRDTLDEVNPIRDHVEQTPDLHPARSDLHGALACATLESGDVRAAIRLYDRALEESIGQYGEVHPATANLRLRLAEAELEGGELAEVERQLAATEASYHEWSTPTPSELATLHGDLAARLALARGKPKAAEALARAALQQLGGARDVDLETVELALGTSLVAQRRFSEAREPLDRARVIAVALHQADADVARIDVQLARVEAGTGHAADARTRAETARAALVKIPGLRIENRDVAGLLANLGDRSR